MDGGGGRGWGAGAVGFGIGCVGGGDCIGRDGLPREGLIMDVLDTGGSGGLTGVGVEGTTGAATDALGISRRVIGGGALGRNGGADGGVGGLDTGEVRRGGS